MGPEYASAALKKAAKTYAAFFRKVKPSFRGKCYRVAFKLRGGPWQSAIVMAGRKAGAIPALKRLDPRACRAKQFKVFSDV